MPFCNNVSIENETIKLARAIIHVSSTPSKPNQRATVRGEINVDGKSHREISLFLLPHSSQSHDNPTLAPDLLGEKGIQSLDCYAAISCMYICDVNQRLILFFCRTQSINFTRTVQNLEVICLINQIIIISVNFKHKRWWRRTQGALRKILSEF